MAKLLTDAELKTKYYNIEFLLYPESMIDDWEDVLPSVTDAEMAYALHDKDVLKNGEADKPHVHLLLHFSNQRGIGTELKKVNMKLSKDGCVASAKPTTDCIITNMEHAYNYLIHDTDDARKKHKYQYDKSVRKFANNFDIGHIVQISSADKLDMKFELMDIIREQCFVELDDALFWIRANKDREYSMIAMDNLFLIERLCKCNFHRAHPNN